jgi:death-on-curing family protein
MSEVVLYTTQDGHVELNVKLSQDTVWLSLNQMAELFGRDKSVISRHLLQIFKSQELDRDSVVANFATTAADGKTYKVDYYNLDAILSVGYRVNSKQGTAFRKWSSQVLKEHLIQGYSINQSRLAEKGIDELQQTIALLQKTLMQHQLVTDLGAETLQLILSYAKTWHLLLAYDEDKLALPNHSQETVLRLNHTDATQAINTLKSDLMACGEATPLFGQERQGAFASILQNIEQTFGGELLYKTIEERAAHLLYFIIKDHPFVDGNKRIGCLIFLLYLKLQNKVIKVNDNGLVALALLVAESEPTQKDLMIRLIVNLLLDK